MTQRTTDDGAGSAHGTRLTRETLVRTALCIVDRDGLDALSMRRLGSELGVNPMAAYRHLPNKGALLDGVVEAVVSQTELATDPSLDWQGQVRQLLDGYLEALLAHPNALPLVTARPLRTPGSLRIVERAFEIMTDAGVDLRDAGRLINVTGLLTAALAMVATAPRVPEEGGAVDPFEDLPPDEFPLLLEAVQTGDLATSVDELLDFAMSSLLATLEDGRTPPDPKERP